MMILVRGVAIGSGNEKNSSCFKLTFLLYYVHVHTILLITHVYTGHAFVHVLSLNR